MALAEDLGKRRAEEHESWRALEALMARLEKGGERALRFEDVERFGSLYRHAAAQLAASREREHDPQRMRYLESLVKRAHFLLYQPPKRGLSPLFQMIIGGFARAYRETMLLELIGIVLFVGGAVIAYVATLGHVEVAYPMLGMMFDAQMVQGLIESDEVRHAYITAGQATGLGARSAFAMALAANNARVGMASFAFGIAAGVPTVLMTIMNGAIMGSLAALFDRRGVDLDFWAWVLPHGIPEVLALTICCAAGLAVGRALVDPRGRPRSEALVEAGRKAAVLIGFALLLLLYAASIEGYFRQFNVGIVPRLLLAAFNATMLIGYLCFAGRAPIEAWARGTEPPPRPPRTPSRKS
jgi:uncharacterized membrane protein SpoIIM required for sporulation